MWVAIWIQKTNSESLDGRHYLRPFQPNHGGSLRGMSLMPCCNSVTLKQWYGTYSVYCFIRENAGTLGMVPLIINPVYTLYSVNLLGPISPF